MSAMCDVSERSEPALKGHIGLHKHPSVVGNVLAHGPQAAFMHQYGGTEQAEDHVEDHAALLPLFGINIYISLHNASWLLEEKETLVVGKLTRS